MGRVRSLMDAFRGLAKQPDALTTGAMSAERQINDCLRTLRGPDRMAFLKSLGDAARAEGRARPNESTFWATVADYAASPQHSEP